MRKKIILSIIGICMVLLVCYRFFPIVILPVNSSNHKLTLVAYGGPYMEKIILKHYVKGEYIKSYVLDLTIEPRYQEPQVYELPRLETGSVEVIVECSYIDEGFSINYENAGDIYETGLLIYTTSDKSTIIKINGVSSRDRYIYFRSGKNQTAFVEKAGAEQWIVADDPPKLKSITKEWMGYSTYDGWKENNWIIKSDE